MNMYSYVDGDPVNFVDPFGLKCVGTVTIEDVEDGETPPPAASSGVRPDCGDAGGGGNFGFGDPFGGFRDGPPSPFFDIGAGPVAPAPGAEDGETGAEEKKKKKIKNPCDTRAQKIGDVLEGSGDAVIFAGIGTAFLGGAAGTVVVPGAGTLIGAGPGILITETGGVISAIGQGVQDLNHGVGFGEIGMRALANAAVARAGSRAVRLTDDFITPKSFDDFIADTAFGAPASALFDYLDPQRCP